MEWGTAKGLAVDLQYNQRIADERFYEQQMKRAQAENQAELTAFENDNDYLNASNSFDYNIIDGEAKKVIKEIGNLAATNPDWRVNPDIRRQINEKRKYLKSNPNVIRGMASDEAFKRLNDDLAKVAKNPNMYDSEAYQDLLAKKQNYLQYGHQDGKEAAAKFGPQSFVYDKPDDFVPLNEEGLKTAQLIKARKYKQHNNGGYEELVDENALQPMAQDFYNRHKRQIQVTYNPKNDEEGIAYAKDLIRPGIELKRKFGEPHYNDALALAKRKAAHDEAKTSGKYNLDPYMYDIKTAKNNRINTDLIQQTLGTTPQAKIYNKDGSFLKLTEGMKFIPSGSFQQVGTVGEKRNPKTGAYEGFGRTSNGNIGVFHGYVEMTEDELDNSGVLDDKSMNDLIVPYEGKDVKGKAVKMYRVPAQVESNLDNEAFRTRYNSAAKITNQQMNSLTSMSEMDKPTQVIQNGITYTLNPSTGQYE